MSSLHYLPFPCPLSPAPVREPEYCFPIWITKPHNRPQRKLLPTNDTICHPTAKVTHSSTLAANTLDEFGRRLHLRSLTSAVCHSISLDGMPQCPPPHMLQQSFSLVHRKLGFILLLSIFHIWFLFGIGRRCAPKLAKALPPLLLGRSFCLPWSAPLFIVELI